MAKKNQQALTIQPVAPLKPVEQRDFYNVPDSTASNLILETLGAGAAIADLPARKRQVNHATTPGSIRRRTAETGTAKDPESQRYY